MMLRLRYDHDALVVGPGLRPGLATAELVRYLIDSGGEDRPPLVLDAEALRSLASMDGWWEGERRPAVLTPHAGEFSRLRVGSGIEPDADGDLVDDDAGRVAAAKDAAAMWHQVVVLKGARTVIASPDGEVVVAPFENPALASGGTGDVLAGTIGSLLAQGLSPFAAARLGVYLHGLAGDAARERFGDAGVLASDLPDGVAIASGVSCRSGIATTSLRTPRCSAAIVENARAIVWKASKSVRVCHGGEIAGLNECTNGCMSVLERSYFSYQVAAGSTMSENSVVLVIRKSRVSSRSSLPTGASSRHVTSRGRSTTSASVARTAWSVPSRCLRKYSLPFPELPSRFERQTVRSLG